MSKLVPCPILLLRKQTLIGPDAHAHFFFSAVCTAYHAASHFTQVDVQQAVRALSIEHIGPNKHDKSQPNKLENLFNEVRWLEVHLVCFLIFVRHYFFPPLLIMPASSSCNERAQHGFVDAIIVSMEQVQLVDAMPTYEELQSRLAAANSQLAATNGRLATASSQLADAAKEIAELKRRLGEP